MRPEGELVNVLSRLLTSLTRVGEDTVVPSSSSPEPLESSSPLEPLGPLEPLSQSFFP